MPGKKKLLGGIFLGLALFLVLDLRKYGGKFETALSSSPLPSEAGSIAELDFRGGVVRRVQARLIQRDTGIEELLVDKLAVEYQLNKGDTVIARGECPPFLAMTKMQQADYGILCNFSAEPNANYHLRVKLTKTPQDGGPLSIAVGIDPTTFKIGGCLLLIALASGSLGVWFLWQSLEGERAR